MLISRLLPAILGAGLTIVKSAAGKDVCGTDASRWDYWWYGTGPRYICKPGEVCHLQHITSKTIGWSHTVGVELEFGLAKSAALTFEDKYTWSESTTTTDTFTVDYYPPNTMRLWIKQWFVVLDMTCQDCSWICYPIGNAINGTEMETGLNVRGQHCEHACDPWRKVTSWVPCKDGSCTEYEISDAYAKCDNSNHCQQDP